MPTKKYNRTTEMISMIEENISLKKYNTFGIEVTAHYFARFSSVDELSAHLDFLPPTISPNSLPILILGGGSNLLFTKDFDGLVLKNELDGIEKIREDEEYVYIKAGAGVGWHQLVIHCIQNNWAGMENLSLIPGNVGASPMQNIGAYGVEIKDIFFELEAFHLKEKSVVTFNLKDCEFGYRESVFKRKYNKQFVILNVTYRLRKLPVFKTAYAAIDQELNKMGVTDLSIQAISKAIVSIRQSKLPTPSEIGNAGSFFKNPEINQHQFESLSKEFPEIIGFPLAEQTVKLAAGWLIEQCGWKGYRNGDAGCYSKQALVLVNYGHSTGAQILELSESIVASVKNKFGIELEREVNIV